MQDISQARKRIALSGELKRLQIIVSLLFIFYSFPFQVRLAALKVLEGFHARLGEDFMVLLPETIPFLAELMEGEPHKLAKDLSLRRLYALTFFKTCYFFYVSDECFEVEEQCQHVISEIEQVLGEPLQKYFW